MGKGIAGRDYYLRLGYCVEPISALVAFLVANFVSQAVIRLIVDNSKCVDNSFKNSPTYEYPLVTRRAYAITPVKMHKVTLSFLENWKLGPISACV